jgi:hypothetical protein
MVELIDNLAMLALSCKSTQEASAIGLHPTWWRFRVFNATKEFRERLWRLYTNPSFVAIHTQFLYGQDTWTTDMFTALPKLEHRNPQNIAETLTHYLMVVLIHRSAYLYGGSASATTPRSTSDGIALRLRISEHEEHITSAHEQRLEGIAAGSSKPLFVHVIASLMNAERFYLEIASFPYVDDALLLRKTKRLVLNAENMGIIYLGCLNLLKNPKVTRTKEGAKYRKISLAIAAIVRPKNMPASSFKGANIVLPDTQGTNIATTNPGKIYELRQRLEGYYQETRLPYLPNLDLPQLTEQLSLPSLQWPTIKRTYATILKENGQAYQTSLTRAMAYRLVVLCAVIKYSESTDPPLSTLSSNGRYTRPDSWRLDWQQVLHLALELVPDWLDRSYFTKDTCRSIWNRISRTDGLWSAVTSLVFEKRNWEILRGM